MYMEADSKTTGKQGYRIGEKRQADKDGTAFA